MQDAVLLSPCTVATIGRDRASPTGLASSIYRWRARKITVNIVYLPVFTTCYNDAPLSILAAPHRVLSFPI
jgi:hypothetical protein